MVSELVSERSQDVHSKYHSLTMDHSLAVEINSTDTLLNRISHYSWYSE